MPWTRRCHPCCGGHRRQTDILAAASVRAAGEPGEDGWLRWLRAARTFHREGAYTRRQGCTGRSGRQSGSRPGVCGPRPWRDAAGHGADDGSGHARPGPGERGRMGHGSGQGMTRRTPLYAGLPESAVPLRVQLLVAPLIPRWLATFIAEAASSGCVELDVVECEGLAPPPSTLRPGLAMRMFLAFERLVFRLLGRAAGRIPDG